MIKNNLISYIQDSENFSTVSKNYLKKKRLFIILILICILLYLD